jgi:hypothetical protein
MSTIQSMTQEERIAALEQSVAELRQSIAHKPAKAPKQSKKAAAEGGAAAQPKPAREPTEWNTLVSRTVAEMKAGGWESWTDLKGVVWPASTLAPVKNKKGEETGAEQYVYDGGDHDGKPPSPALGGMVRASYLKTLSDPAAKAKAEAYHAKLAEKRSNASTGSGAREEPVADAPGAGKKGRKMTEEQKAAAKAKRDAKKATAAATVLAEEKELAADEAEAEAEDDFEEVDAEAQTPLPETSAPTPLVFATAARPASAAAAAKSKFPVGLPKLAGGSMAAIRAGVAAQKKMDLTLTPWTFKGKKYLTNDRKDVVTEDLEWVGRFNGGSIDKSVAEPADMGEVGLREE